MTTGREGAGERRVRVGDEHAQQARHDGPVLVPVEGRHHGVADPDLTVPDPTVLVRTRASSSPANASGTKSRKAPVSSVTTRGDGGVALRCGTGLLGHHGP
jgi:hypothetical protein